MRQFIQLLTLFSISLFARYTVAQTPFITWSPKPEIEVRLGKQADYIPSRRGGLTHFPDEPICILKKKPLFFLMVSRTGTWLMTGKDLKSAKPVRMVLKPGKPSEPDNGYAGVASTYQNGKRLLAFYHAEDHEGELGFNPKATIPGWYGSVCLATGSKDEEMLSKVGPIITSQQPKLERGWKKMVLRGIVCAGSEVVAMPV
jgi:hypothetical protein